MRAIRPLRLIVLSGLLIATALLVGDYTEPVVAFPAKMPLQQEFSRFGQWRGYREFPIDQKTVQALDLDDFLFRSYRRNQKNVDLYIGYYRRAKKVGAAHDPLVCFQGQGWKIDGRDSGSYSLAARPELTISYSFLLVERQNRREVIVYWFQANEKAAASTGSQKMAMVLRKISGKTEDNAFVRLSASVGAGSPDAARNRIFEFVEDFYPEFLRYITRS
jgi:EpsI family protein